MDPAIVSDSRRAARRTTTVRGCARQRPSTRPSSARPPRRRDMASTVTNQEVVAEQAAAVAPDGQWPLWEVFTQSEHGAPHEHAGSLHAMDAAHAPQNAPHVCARRRGMIPLWIA